LLIGATAANDGATSMASSCSDGAASTTSSHSGGTTSRGVMRARAEVQHYHAGPEKTRHRQCVTVETGVQPEVVDERNKIISLILFLLEYVK